MEDQRWSAELAQAIHHVHEVSGRRVYVTVLPAEWTDERCRRLTLCISTALNGGESDLRAIEDALFG